MTTLPRDPSTEAQIASRAHALWEEEGRPEGRDKEHWERAEREVLDVADDLPERLFPGEPPAPAPIPAALQASQGRQVTDPLT